MDGRFEGVAGGILGILEELDAYGDAIEYDLLQVGLRLDDIGTGRCTWRDVLVNVRCASRDSAYARARLGADADWSLQNDLLAGLYDLMQVHRWADAPKGKRGPRPKPIDRPSVRGESGEARTIGRGTSMPVDEFDEWLAMAEGRAA